MMTAETVHQRGIPTGGQFSPGGAGRLVLPYSWGWLGGLAIVIGFFVRICPAYVVTTTSLCITEVGHEPYSVFPKITSQLYVTTRAGSTCCLTGADYYVTEDGVPQTIDSITCTRQNSKVADIVMLFDITGSMSDNISPMVSGAVELSQQIATAGVNARYGLISFDDSVHLNLSLNPDVKAFQSAAMRLLGLGRQSPRTNNRHLACPESSVDAVIVALEQMKYRPSSQIIFVLMTDEESNVVENGESSYSMVQAIERLEAVRARVFTISSSPSAVSSLNPDNDPRWMAEKTGGLWLDIQSADFSKIRDGILTMLVPVDVIQYSTCTLQYTTTNPQMDGTRRRVCVTVTDPLEGSHMDCGYYTAPCLDYTPTDPYPADGAIDIPLGVLLKWTARCSRNAVYFGTAYPPITVVSSSVSNEYNTGPLLSGTTYYWMIVSDSSLCPCAPVTPPVWSFHTRVVPTPTLSPVPSSTPTPSLTPTPSPTPAHCGLFTVRLNGRSETPPNSSSASGIGAFLIDTYYNTVTYNIQCGGLAAGAETAANFHGLAPPGFNAPPIQVLPLGNSKIGIWNYDESIETGLMAGNVYVNICTSEYPAGEIRAQVRRSDASPVSFDFETSPEGWINGGSPPFVAPEPRFDPGRLSLVSSENTNTFGFWESPLLVFCRSPYNLDFPQIILQDDQSGDPCFLFRSVFSLSSDTSDSLRVPIIRFRSSSESFEQSDVLVATSVGSSDFSPQPGGRWYTHYFTIPPNQSGFRLDFDLLNMDPKDSPDAVVSIEQFEVEGAAWDSLGPPRLEKKYAFIIDPLDWTPRTAATMKEPLFEVNTFGLQIRGVAADDHESTGSIIFGYWSSSETASDAVKLEGNRLYRATFRVASDAVKSRPVCVPAFRLRLNDSTMRSCAYVNVESRYEDSRVPAGGKFESYYVYLYVPPQLAGGRLVLSFDYLYVPGGQNDPTIAIRMPWVEVESFALPDAIP